MNDTKTPTAAEQAAANAELGRVNKRADFLDSSLDAMRQQSINAVKARNAATERAEQAEAEAERLRIDRDHCVAREVSKGLEVRQLRKERDEARARLTKLRLLRLEWSTANCYSDLGDDIVSERLARDRVASRSEIHAAVVSRQIYAGPWCEGACRSCGTDERVAGDPPLCSGCVVYGGGWSAQRPDASLDGLRGPFTGLLGPFGLNSEESDNA